MITHSYHRKKDNMNKTNVIEAIFGKNLSKVFGCRILYTPLNQIEERDRLARMKAQSIQLGKGSGPFGLPEVPEDTFEVEDSDFLL